MEIKYDTSKPMGPTSRTADITKARALLGWQSGDRLDGRSKAHIYLGGKKT